MSIVPGKRIEAIQSDITVLALDAIVNAANEPLIMGGGVDGAIRRKAGMEMETELRKIGRCPPGHAVITRGHRLAAKFVIHTVAPIWTEDGATPEQKEALLASCYRNALLLAAQNGIRSIAFPCIGTGIYGWPPDKAAAIAFSTVTGQLKADSTVQHVVFCCFSEEDLRRYTALIEAQPD